MRKTLLLVALIGILSLLGTNSTVAQSTQASIKAVRFEFDPGATGTVAARWVKHLGLTDDVDTWGLLLSKNTVTPTFSSAGATIKPIPDALAMTELGFDVRKGGHCGAGAPRFNVVTNDNVTHFFGCTYGLHTPDTPAPSWERVRLAPADGFPPVVPGNTIKSLEIVMDEGTDTGPDFSGLVVLDNIDLNGTLIGKPSLVPFP